ncbi:MAG: MerR family transcriptional regulator, partial [Anaerolineaceae bacterium]
MISKIPIYNLNAVCRETGLKADVLRAWERRYKLPMPQRSTGGHRLYSQYDIEIIKWLQARQGEGLSISRAVELWMEIIEAGRNPFADYSSVITPANTPLPAADTRIDIIRSQWLDACMNFDNEKAEDILNQSFALYPVEVVCTEVLQQGLKTVGDLWYSGKASVQQEHFASALAVR